MQLFGSRKKKNSSKFPIRESILGFMIILYTLGYFPASMTPYIASYSYLVVIFIIYISLMYKIKFSLLFSNIMFILTLIMLDIVGNASIFEGWIFLRTLYLIILNLFSFSISYTIQVRKNLEQANSELIELVNVLNHDLKTPINSIIAYTKLIKLNQLENNNVSLPYLTNIEKQIHYINNFVSKSLEIAQAKQSVSLKQTSLKEIFKDIKGFYSDQININLEMKEDLKVEADRDKLIQVFINLVDNALSHGEATNVTFSVEKSTNNNMNRIKVMNNGKIINADKIEFVWSKGYSKSAEHLGLGLSIVKSIILAHNWDIKLETNPQTTFVIEIPIQST